MAVLTVPGDDGHEWPSLGWLVCDFIESALVFGPGDLKGRPARLDPEKRAFVWRFYELHPEGTPSAGRRRFRRCALSLRKGTAKSELAAWIAAAELHPEGPVRFDGWDAHGRPKGRPVVSPYIPMLAFTEEQSEDLAYGALLLILENSPVRAAFDLGLERIKRAAGDGVAMPLASAPSSRDGALTTFQHKDETHRWNTKRLRDVHRTTLANLPKRLGADPWELETTTAYSPGEQSVAEETRAYAEDVADGKIDDSRLFYFHRQAADGYDFGLPDQRRKAVIEASGPAAEWSDIDGICDQWQDPKADRNYLERVWCNRATSAAAQAFDSDAWARNRRGGPPPPAGALIVLGFDGSLSEDATALVATHVATRRQFPLGIWERPRGPAGEGWHVDKVEVDAVVDEAFRLWNVWRMYGDPSKWESEMAVWAGRYGDQRVVAWSTTLYRKLALALKAYARAIEDGDCTNNGDPDLARHIGNAQRNPQRFVDDDESPLWLIRKDRPNSANKIDGAMAGALAWAACLDAIAGGATETAPSVYEARGILTL